MRHEAKVDWWIGLTIVAAFVVPCAGAIAASTPFGYAASGIVALLVLGFCWPQWYETAGDALVIRAGLTTRRIPYSTITVVRPSSDTSSSFAMSLDRVEIEYGSRKILIAPKDQDAFVADLAIRTAPTLPARAESHHTLCPHGVSGSQ